jgi:hypothetical protein
MKKINSTLHGIIDYVTVAGFYAAPHLLRMSKKNANFVSAFSTAYLGLSMNTAYPLSTKKLIPFPIHGLIEAGSALGLLALSLNPLIQKRARCFYFLSAVQLGAVVALTNYSDTAQKAEMPGFESGDDEEVSKDEKVRADEKVEAEVH